MGLLGTPTALEGTLTEEDVEAMKRIAVVLDAGFPLVALLQLVRVYAQSMRKIADAEVRLFHLYVHEPLIRDGVDALEMAEEMEGLAGDLLPMAAPLIEYIHDRYLRFYIEQDVVGHMETELVGARQLGRVPMAFCFVDLDGLHPLHRGGGRRGGARPGRALRRDGRGDAAERGADREDDRRRGDDRLARPRVADRVGGRLPRPLRGAPAAAGRHPLRRGRLPRRRLLRRATSTSPTGSSPARSAAR